MLALIFEQPSTRTRVSFDVGMRQMGGETMVLSGERHAAWPWRDHRRHRPRAVALCRCHHDPHLEAFEPARNLPQHATVPVINGLTNLTHPCQIMADVMTLEEHVAPLKDLKVGWVGDGNNVAASWIHAVGRLGGKLAHRLRRRNCARRPKFWPGPRRQGADVSVTRFAEEAVTGADCVVTDAWVSMHDTDAASRHNLLEPYQVNERLMELAQARRHVHALPARPSRRGGDRRGHRRPQSVVFDEAENRLHIQKSILLHCLGA